MTALTREQQLADIDAVLVELRASRLKVAAGTTITVAVDGSSVTYKSLGSINRAINALEQRRRWVDKPRRNITFGPPGA